MQQSFKDIASNVGEGWHLLLDDLIKDLLSLGWDGEIAQVKEKFGGLRFYIRGGNDAIYERINKAETLSLRTCDQCGEPGKSSSWGGYWVSTLCPACGVKRAEEVRVNREKYGR